MSGEKTVERDLAQRRRRYRAMWGARALLLGLGGSLSGTLFGWSIQRHEPQVTFEAAGIMVCIIAVIILNWRIND